MLGEAKVRVIIATLKLIFAIHRVKEEQRQSVGGRWREDCRYSHPTSQGLVMADTATMNYEYL